MANKKKHEKHQFNAHFREETDIKEQTQHIGEREQTSTYFQLHNLNTGQHSAVRPGTSFASLEAIALRRSGRSRHYHQEIDVKPRFPRRFPSRPSSIIRTNHVHWEQHLDTSLATCPRGLVVVHFQLRAWNVDGGKTLEISPFQRTNYSSCIRKQSVVVPFSSIQMLRSS